MALRLSYGLMAVVLAGALLLGARSDGPRTAAQRADDIAASVKCPICDGETVKESSAAASELIKAEIVRMVDEGRSDAEIRDHLANSYGEAILLRPRASGLAGLVWVIPVVGLVAAGGGLGYAFWRWRRWPT